LDLIATFSELPMAMATVKALQPDIFLLDTQLLGDDTRPLRQIKEGAPGTKVLLVGVPEREIAASYVLDHGVKGILAREPNPDLCLRAISAVHAGDVWVTRNTLAQLLNAMLAQLDGSAGPQAPSAPLTPRESETLCLTKQGLTTKEVARRLGLSPNTIKSHLRSAFHKLHISRRMQIDAPMGSRTPVALRATRPGAGA
jgi:DNA-binding NarL/FixJ family response regulator